MTIRSVRNNNPGNLTIGPAWFGLQPRERMTPEQAAETKFAVFKTPMFGFRALAITLQNYERKHGLNTVAGIITRFAPSTENDTTAYIAAVSKALNVEPDDKLDMSSIPTMCSLCEAISIHEAGKWAFSEADLNDGVGFALV